ncbi:MarR family winged helix-turn-helix transcriptional regulator [Caballeronia grimmiae]|uniref:MarR family transcriptional regulator n=2 Tax=Caballeronia grimmiae TaxID=1071679 RepID=A0A069NH76_9BURK|nr:MarR family transcriptional regulator [Caballeronia grimmiae]
MTPCFCTNLRLATRRLSAAYDAALEPLGMNIGQYFLLRTIAERQQISLTDLGQLTELERSTVGRNVRVLERMGLVATGRGEADQREALVALTAEGLARMRDALPIWEETQKDFATRLGAEKVNLLNAVLEAV